ncbi:putative C-mannosyltransferase DPY19L2 [Taenia crassiceps]|uniref:C-mannosyltransferase DPY19L2 n=1 Tax=Taenia crassiceps TaxID=6207 RepID=A0ABR4Q6G2_9CEST
MSARRRHGVRPSSVSSYSISASSSSSDEADMPLPQRPQRAPPRLRRPSRLPGTLLVIAIAVFSGLLHCGHVASLHENHLSFAYLSNIERELTFRSEMAFYYSFYKQMILAESFCSGLDSLFNDTMTEYPCILGNVEEWKMEEWGLLPGYSTHEAAADGVRVLERFNIYPEVILAGLYRILRYFDLLHSECFEVVIEGISKVHALAVPAKQINGNSSFLPPLEPMGTLTGDKVLSCEGSREPPIFYVDSVFCLTGLTVMGLVLSGWLVASSGSGGGCGGGSVFSLATTIWGAVLPLVGFFFNHAEATRVQWSPPLRESFAFPFFVLQQSLLIWLLQDISPVRRQHRHVFSHLFYILLLLAFQLPWQFAQFALLTQLLALLATYVAVALVTLLSASPSLTPSAVSVNVSFGVLCSLARCLLEVLGCQLVALIIAWTAQLRNRLLLTSAYLPCLVGCLFGLYVHWNLLNRRKWTNSRATRCAHLLVLAVSCLVGALIVRLFLRQMVVDFSDGAHIMDLVKVKLLHGNRTFHTQLYTCSEAFDFLPMSTWLELTRTGLLPCGALAVLVTIRQLLLPCRSDYTTSTLASSAASKAAAEATSKKKLDKRAVAEDDSEASDGEAGASTVSFKSQCLQEQILLARTIPAFIADVISVFIIMQLFAFGVLAVLVMRLKLFFTPQLCLSLAILSQPRLFFGSQKILPQIMPINQRGPRKRRRSAHHPTAAAFVPSWRKLLAIHTVFVLAVAFASQRGMHNLREEWSKQGQFSDFTMETLLHWAAQLPPPPPAPHPDVWVFSGAMPTMATLRLGLVVPSLPSSYPSAGNATVTGRRARFAVTNHPHYENAAIRWRTELAYVVCSRKPVEAVWRIYRHVLKVDFVVIERDWCLSPGAKPGCSSVELWDLLDPVLAGHNAPGPLCEAAFEDAPLPESFSRFFSPVFRSMDRTLVVWRVAP